MRGVWCLPSYDTVNVTAKKNDNMISWYNSNLIQTDETSSMEWVWRLPIIYGGVQEQKRNFDILGQPLTNAWHQYHNVIDEPLVFITRSKSLNYTVRLSLFILVLPFNMESNKYRGFIYKKGAILHPLYSNVCR